MMTIRSLCLLFFLSLRVTRAADPDFDINDMMSQNCPNFRCSAGQTPTPRSRVKFESMGCSSMGGGAVMMAGADATGDKPYESCCDQWHACYQICGVSKKTCDTTFETCAKEGCGADETCTKDVELNTMMMKLGGCQKFNEAQYKACECTQKDQAPAKRQAALRYFYKKYAPDSVDKAESLAAKADTPSKMAGLLIKLLLKYPAAIQKVEDPMKKMYDKIRTESSTEGGTKVEEQTDEEEIPSEDHIEL